jgi:hypothetical protein
MILEASKPATVLRAFAMVVVFCNTSAVAAALNYPDIINASDSTFNQDLGINNGGVIAGYSGSGASGHPNKGYTTVPPYTSFTNENFTGSVQTQVTGLNKNGTTVGFGPIPILALEWIIISDS